jgi:hypothetical protein
MVVVAVVVLTVLPLVLVALEVEALGTWATRPMREVARLEQSTQAVEAVVLAVPGSLPLPISGVVVVLVVLVS